MNRPLVSVIINCYNGEPFLRKALESVRVQSYAEWEIIFWDNASTDSSAAIAQAFGPQLRYFKSPETLPLGAARNKALAEARGVYVTILDCDDTLLPHALETLVGALEGNRCALAYAGVVLVDSTGREIRRQIPKARGGNLLAVQLRKYEIGVPAVMIRRQVLIEDALGFDPALRIAEDYCLFMQIAAAHEICASPEVLARYLVHPGALTQKTMAYWGDEVEYTLKLLAAKHPGLRDRHKAGFRMAHAQAAYYRARYYAAQRQRGKALKALVKYLYVDYRYPILFLLLLLPLSIWDFIHERRSARSFRT